MFAVSSIRPVRPVSRGLLALAVLGMLLASLLPVANATPFAPRAALASHTAAPTTCHDRRRPPEELGCPGDWEPDCAATPSRLRRRRRRLAGLVRVSRPATGSTRRRSTTRGTRTTACTPPGGDNIPLNLGAGQTVKFYYDARNALGHRQRHSSDRDRCPAASSPSSAAPATGSPTASARGSRIPTATATYTFATTAHPGRQLRGQGRAQRGLGRELRRGRRPARRQHRTSPSRATRRSRSATTRVTHVLTIQSASQARSPTTTSSGTACATTRATRSTGRPAARCPRGRRSPSASARSTTT